MDMADESKTQTGAREWFTIPEAAEYLGVSEPTIYRWMRDGILSFYKVGGSTRFTEEGLEALIEKTTGRKEAEAAKGRCAACAHGVMVEGRVQGTGRLYFKPAHTKFWVLEESLVPIKAQVCTACGYVQMNADTARLGRLLRDEDKEAQSNE
jgi:excisionase family DNA binding protein